MQNSRNQNGATSFKNVGFTHEDIGFTREQAVKIPMIIALLSLTTMLTVPIILMWWNGAFRTI